LAFDTKLPQRHREHGAAYEESYEEARKKGKQEKSVEKNLNSIVTAISRISVFSIFSSKSPAFLASLQAVSKLGIGWLGSTEGSPQQPIHWGLGGTRPQPPLKEVQF
jgi:hypothetical protein